MSNIWGNMNIDFSIDIDISTSNHYNKDFNIDEYLTLIKYSKYSFIKKCYFANFNGRIIYFKQSKKIFNSSFFKLTILNQKVIHSFRRMVDDEYFIKNTFKNYENYYTKEYIIHCEKMELERNLKETNNNKKVIKI